MKVRIFGTLRSLVRANAVDVEVGAGDTVRIVLERLAAEYPALKRKLWDEDGNLQSSINVLVNGRSIRFLEGLDSPVQASDRFALFPAVGGG